jgi:hypothetical protein
MSVSHCMHQALAIARTAPETWRSRVDGLPNGCSHSDCGMPKSCRERIADYLRMQLRIRKLKERSTARAKQDRDS